MLAADDYTIYVSPDARSSEYVATVREFPSLSWLAPTEALAVKGMRRLLTEVLDDLG